MRSLSSEGMESGLSLIFRRQEMSENSRPWRTGAARILRGTGVSVFIQALGSARGEWRIVDPPEIVGKSPTIRTLLEKVALLAGSDVPVLIEGESGTGKELVARALHRLGSRRDRPFLAINSGGLTDSLLESELFGYQRGAFTGAHGEKPGLVEAADQGTLFLDEVGDLSPSAQTRLLRVLQEGEILRVGGVGPKRVDVRIISATHRCLEEEVQRGRFRLDLYYRLRVVALPVPPLRERAEDIPILVRHFLDRYSAAYPPSLEPAALDLLLKYPWPGNVRELENEVRRVITLLGQGRVIPPEILSTRIRKYPEQPPGEGSLKSLVSRYEAMVIRETLDRYAWNKTRAAIALGVSRQSLIRKVSRYGLDGRLRTGASRSRILPSQGSTGESDPRRC
jgi:transcriptional regulator with PAS, ATPase and Fis domain